MSDLGLDASQEVKITVMQLKIERLEEKQNDLRERLKSVEKWVIGAAAVIAAAVAGLGLIEATDFGMAKTSKQAQEHRDYFVNILHPAMERSNWLGKDYSNLEGEKPPEWIKKK